MRFKFTIAYSQSLTHSLIHSGWYGFQIENTFWNLEIKLQSSRYEDDDDDEAAAAAAEVMAMAMI